jgi:hypothetical protein
MALSADLIIRLLGAVEIDSLMFLCGAGLSIPSPSDLVPAVGISQRCYDRWAATETLDPAFREDIDRLAGYFHTRGDFKVFIGLVPWNDLVGTPNKGHAAIADLLITRGVRAALSANFDSLIERWAEDRRVAMQGALNGQEAVAFTSNTSPLVKFHGCLHRDRENTLWTQAQLKETTIQARVASCSEWMKLNLPDKDLIVVGFWTDWGYLNDILADTFAINTARSVTVIDPCPSAALETKAPRLWANLTRMSLAFEHVQASGNDALDQLRTAFSKAWARKFFALGQPLVVSDGGTIPAAATPDALTGEDLYNLRRDAQGVPYNRAATWKVPEQNASQVAFVHMKLLNAGATQQGAWLEHGGRTIRVINGSGQGLANVQAGYKEPPPISQSEIVVCVGAMNLGVPARVIASGRGASMIRPTPGGSATWLTFEEALVELAL